MDHGRHSVMPTLAVRSEGPDVTLPPHIASDLSAAEDELFNAVYQSFFIPCSMPPSSTQGLAPELSGQYANTTRPVNGERAPQDYSTVSAFTAKATALHITAERYPRDACQTSDLVHGVPQVEYSDSTKWGPPPSLPGAWLESRGATPTPPLAQVALQLDRGPLTAQDETDRFNEVWQSFFIPRSFDRHGSTNPAPAQVQGEYYADAPQHVHEEPVPQAYPVESTIIDDTFDPTVVHGTTMQGPGDVHTVSNAVGATLPGGDQSVIQYASPAVVAHVGRERSCTIEADVNDGYDTREGKHFPATQPPTYGMHPPPPARHSSYSELAQAASHTFTDDTTPFSTNGFGTARRTTVSTMSDLAICAVSSHNSSGMIGSPSQISLSPPSAPAAGIDRPSNIGYTSGQDVRLQSRSAMPDMPYAAMHPAGPKADYRWRLYALHRAMEAGIEDVGMGALYGLADWRFELLANVLHAQDLERVFGPGPHTISFPRMEPALNTPLASRPPQAVDDATFLRIITVLRLAVPYVGMICTARESAGIRRQALKLGVTQVDASSNVGVGAYVAEAGGTGQEGERQQFMLGDTRSLTEVIQELAEGGSLTSFCTAGYRCGRTGKCIMDLLRNGMEGKFCKLNAALTFREYIDDFGTPALRAAGEALLTRELGDIDAEIAPDMAATFRERYERTCRGERDLFF